jgi:PAB-dependent poly(A)-specific ribonuclease subunit 3
MAEWQNAQEFVPGGSRQPTPQPVFQEFIPGGSRQPTPQPQFKEWVPGQGVVAQADQQEAAGFEQGAYGGGSGGGEYDDENGEGEVQTTDPGLLWAEGLPDCTNPAPPKRSLQTIGIPEPIREHFRSLDQTSSKQMEPSDDRYKELPNRYHSAYPLDDFYSFSPQQRGIGGSYGYPSAVYKAIDKSDSQMYAIRRVDNVRMTANTSHLGMQVTRKWYEVRHPSIVSLYSISMERSAVFFNHAYYPGAQTLRQRYIDQRDVPLPEALIWRIMVQLISAVRLVHLRGMAMRNISASHVILTSGTMARFTGSGIVDMLEADSRKTVAEMQTEDLVKLGYLLLALVARHITTPKNAEQALQALTRNFSQDLQRLVGALLQGKATISQISQLISDRVHDELDQFMAAGDALHNHLRGEYESTRIMRLMFKLQHINERPEFARDSQWSETGDRYILKLFRDYVFHQSHGESGAPVLDSGHVITALNKLDCGDPERILLSSRDNKDLLVVSFADIKNCLDHAFAALNTEAERHSPSHRDSNNGNGGNGGAGMGGMMIGGGVPGGGMGGMRQGAMPAPGGMRPGPGGYNSGGRVAGHRQAYF